MSSETLPTSDDTTSSSPAPAVFSDGITRSSTPPSSPPGFPWDEDKAAQNASITQPSTRAPTAFSILGKRKALTNIDDNARPSKKIAAPQISKRSQQHLTQMQISLGQTTQKKCKVCGMEYVPSSDDDRKLHDKYHRQNTEGYDVGKDFLTLAANKDGSSHIKTFPGVQKDDAICMIDSNDRPARRRRAQAVLEIVQRELGAVEIPHEELWSRLECVSGEQSMYRGKFQSYLYVRGTRCVGFLLVQKIERAFRVLEPLPPPPAKRSKELRETQMTAAGALKAREEAAAEQLKQPLRLAEESSRAELGISRIWTSPTHRRVGIAAALLDAALEDYGIRESSGRSSLHPSPSYDKDCVAFSQPTEAGTRLARKWFGRNYGWMVYAD